MLRRAIHLRYVYYLSVLIISRVFIEFGNNSRLQKALRTKIVIHRSYFSNKNSDEKTNSSIMLSPL